MLECLLIFFSKHDYCLCIDLQLSDRQKPRGNVEERQESLNSIDPMMLQPEWRDHLPKMGLNGKYVGDDYILCSGMCTPLESGHYYGIYLVSCDP